jgi:hypothetical protein
VASADPAHADDSLKLRYALAALAVFLVEVVIAVFWRDGFVRPYLGDVLAVVLLYLALRALTPLSPISAATAALAVAVLIELAQLFHVLDAVGLGRNALARTVLGGVFDVADLACYAIGGLAVLSLDRAWIRRSSPTGPG